MSALRAVRRCSDAFDEDARDGLCRAAARTGTLHRSEELAVATFGLARSIELPFGLEDRAASLRVGEVLASIDLTGDDGPGGSGVLGVGALPFDPGARAGLVVPSLVVAWRPGSTDTWVTHVVAPSTPPDPVDTARSIAKDAAPLGPRGDVTATEERPAAARWREAVVQCLDSLRRGEAEKVVLARALEVTASVALDPARLAATLSGADPGCTLYAYPGAPGRFVGASPELICATARGRVRAHPLAGTVALRGEADDDERIAWLVASAKNRHEHAVVVDDVVRRLEPLCEALEVPDAPSPVRLSTDARLGTRIEGELLGAEDAETAMQVLAALHPTPAVGGHPRAKALGLIARLEHAPRGLWAGAAGWLDADGTSTWTLALRGVRLQGARAELWSGAGIVSDSDPDDEVDETAAKLASVLGALSR